MILDPIIQDAALSDVTPAIEGGSGSAGVSPGSAAPAALLQSNATNLPQQNGDSNLVAIAVGAVAGVMLVLGMIAFICLRGRGKLAPKDPLCVSCTLVFAPAT